MSSCGCDLGRLELCDGSPPPDAVVVAPPRSQRAAALPGLRRPVSIAVTGWAIDPAWRRRLGAEYAVPLSDHADFDELGECIERVAPRIVYCTHGPPSLFKSCGGGGTMLTRWRLARRRCPLFA